MALGFGIRKIGQAFDISIKRLTDSNNNKLEENWQYSCTMIVRGKSPRTIHAYLGFTNLPKGRYSFKFEPTSIITGDKEDKSGSIVATESQRNNNTFRIASEWYQRETSYRTTTYNTNASFEGYTTKIKGQISNLSPQDMSSWEEAYLTDPLEKWYETELNFEDNLPFTTTSINEIVYSEEEVVYPDTSILEIELQASERLTNPPNLSVEIEEGTIIRNFYAWGTVDSKIDNYTITVNQDITVPHSELEEEETNLAILDPKRNRTSSFQTSANEINLESSFSKIEEGDEVVFFFNNSSCLLPDIFADLLLNQQYGIGSLVKPRMIDWESIVTSNRFCYENNYFFDSVIEQKENFNQWITSQAPTCLLLPVRKENKYGLIPESPESPIKAVFNESNILKGTFQRTTVPVSERQLNKVIVVYTDGRSDRKETVSIEALTKEAFEGKAAIREKRKNYSSITRPEQAEDVAILALNSSRFQTEEVSFETDSYGLEIEPGDIIVVQQRVDQFNYNGSGIITDASDEDNKIDLYLDNPLRGNYEGYSVYIKYYEGNGNLNDGDVIKVDVIDNTEEKLIINDTYETSDGDTASVPVPSPGDPILLVRNQVENRKYRVQKVDINEEGISIQGLQWTPNLIKGTSQDEERSMEELDSGYKMINDDIAIFRE